MRVEARGVGHRDPGPDDGALEGPGEVAVAGEAEPAALGVADAEPLDRRGLLLGLVTHGRTLPAGAVRSVREDVAVIAPDQTVPHTRHPRRAGPRRGRHRGPRVQPAARRGVTSGRCSTRSPTGLGHAAAPRPACSPPCRCSPSRASAPWRPGWPACSGCTGSRSSRSLSRGGRARAALPDRQRAGVPAAVAARAGRHGDRERAAALPGEAALPRPGRADDLDLHDLARGRPHPVVGADRAGRPSTSGRGAGACSPGR